MSLILNFSLTTLVFAQKDKLSLSTAIFAGGCFWHLDSAFAKLEGVVDTQVGFTGGKIPFPKYRNVTTGTTGHVEAIRITFEHNLISYSDLLAVFWSIHDPRYPYRRSIGPGAQYQSIIFFFNSDQEKIAREFLSQQEYPDQISTQLSRVKPFYPAESYHQDYFQKKQSQCPVLKREK